MNDDPIQSLEHELLRAARRQSARARWRRVAPAGSRLVTLGAVAAVLVALAVTADAIAMLSAGGAPSRPSAVAAEPANRRSPAQQLDAILGVLRRPATAADRPSPRAAPWMTTAGIATILGTRIVAERGAMRLATTTSGRLRIFLMPTRSAAGQYAAAVVIMAAPPRHGGGMVFGGAIRPGGTVARIEAGRMVVELPAACCDRPLKPLYVVVVPDGVSVVAVTYVAKSGGSGPVTAMLSFTDSVPVRGNVVTFGPGPLGAVPATMTWHAADGAVLKRVPVRAGTA